MHCCTGAQDGSIKVWDTRAMRGPDHTICSLRSHTDAIIRLEWHPQAKVKSSNTNIAMKAWCDMCCCMQAGVLPSVEEQKILRRVPRICESQQHSSVTYSALLAICYDF